MRLWRSVLPVMAAALVAVAAHAQAPTQDGSDRSAAELMDAVMWEKEPIGGPFALTDHTGRPRTEADFRGRLMLVYFGFTYCPDICPTDLMAMGQALDRLGADADGVQPLFITLDPERDTQDVLADYLPMFHPRMLGLRGDAAAIKAAAAQYRVYHRKAKTGDALAYTIDHSAFVYLMGRDGAYLGFFPPGTAPDRMAGAIRPHLKAKP